MLPEGVKEARKDWIKDTHEKAEQIKSSQPAKADDSKNYSEIITDIEQHIDCYPWQRQLFEHFGIRYKKNKSKEDNRGQIIRYTDFARIAAKKWFGFSDVKYNQFPYNGKDPFNEKICD